MPVPVPAPNLHFHFHFHLSLSLSLYLSVSLSLYLSISLSLYLSISLSLFLSISLPLYLSISRAAPQLGEPLVLEQPLIADKMGSTPTGAAAEVIRFERLGNKVSETTDFVRFWQIGTPASTSVKQYFLKIAATPLVLTPFVPFRREDL